MSIEDWKQIEDVSYLKERVASLEHRVEQLEALGARLIKAIGPMEKSVGATAKHYKVTGETLNGALKAHGADEWSR